MFTSANFPKFLSQLIKYLKSPILIFAVGIIIIVSLFGANIPETYQGLIYAVTIGALVLYFITMLLEMWLHTPKPASAAPDKTLSGAILYVNVKRYSLLKGTDQEKIARKLQDELVTFLGSKAQNVFEAGGKYWVDFWGGDLILFVSDEAQEPYNATLKCLILGMHLQLLAKDVPCVLSIILNWGENLKTSNILGVSGVYGNALHSTRNMIAFTDDSHFIISERAASKLTGVFSNETSGTCDSLVEPIEKIGSSSVYLRQIKRDNLFQLAKNTNQDFYSFYITDPANCMTVGSKLSLLERATIDFLNVTPGLACVNQRLVNFLVNAEDVVLIDITHDNLVAVLQEALDKRNKVFWRTINIVFPDKSTMQKVVKQGSISVDKSLRIEETKREVQIFFERQDASYIGRWNCLEYGDTLPLVGNRFVQKNNGLIHFGVVFPGERLSEIAYFEFYQKTKVYEQFSRVFDLILAGSTSISEWDLFGRIAKDENARDQFLYSGVVNRARISVELKNTQGFSEFYFPVVLVVLYMEALGGGYTSVLQERTPYNSTSDYGTFSNISGRLSTDDALEASHGYFKLSFDKFAIVATDSFNDFSGWKSGQVTREDVWKRAAIREIGEELGLEIAPERLEFQGAHYLQRDDGNLYFQIYSLMLRRDVRVNEHELDLINQCRPYTSLKQFTFPELEALWRQKKLNRLLQRRFLEVFVPIFSKKKINGSPKESDVPAYIRALMPPK